MTPSKEITETLSMLEPGCELPLLEELMLMASPRKSV